MATAPPEDVTSGAEAHPVRRPHARLPLTRRQILTGAAVVGSALAHTLTSGTFADGPPASSFARAARRNSTEVDPKAHGATGDGVTDDTMALNAAVTAAGPGGVVHVRAGKYRVNAVTGNSRGVVLDQPGLTFRMDDAAILEALPNNAARYAVVAITAADVTIEGGAIKGDLLAHKGNTGEWGHGVEITEMGHRATVRGTRVSHCWGDGICIGDTVKSYIDGVLAEDILIADVVCDTVRRNGLSLVGGTNTRIVGGAYRNAGRFRGTAPMSGICVEPNPDGEQHVRNFLISDADCSENASNGLLVHGQGQTCTGTVDGVTANRNGAFGFVTTATAAVAFLASMARANADGFAADGFPHARSTYTACRSIGNSGVGFGVPGTNTASNCRAENNGYCGFYLTDKSKAVECVAIGNNTKDAYYGQYAVEHGTGVSITDCRSEVGYNTVKPTRGYHVLSGSTRTVVSGCTVTGRFTAGSFVDFGIATKFVGAENRRSGASR